METTKFNAVGINSISLSNGIIIKAKKGVIEVPDTILESEEFAEAYANIYRAAGMSLFEPGMEPKEEEPVVQKDIEINNIDYSVFNNMVKIA